MIIRVGNKNISWSTRHCSTSLAGLILNYGLYHQAKHEIFRSYTYNTFQCQLFCPNWDLDILCSIPIPTICLGMASQSIQKVDDSYPYLDILKWIVHVQGCYHVSSLIDYVEHPEFISELFDCFATFPEVQIVISKSELRHSEIIWFADIIYRVSLVVQIG